MKTAKDIFLTVGLPIVTEKGRSISVNYSNFRAFTEADIAQIQGEALAVANEGMNAAMPIIEKVAAAGNDEAAAWLKRHYPGLFTKGPSW